MIQDGDSSMANERSLTKEEYAQHDNDEPVLKGSSSESNAVVEQPPPPPQDAAPQVSRNNDAAADEARSRDNALSDFHPSAAPPTTETTSNPNSRLTDQGDKPSSGEGAEEETTYTAGKTVAHDDDEELAMGIAESKDKAVVPSHGKGGSLELRRSQGSEDMLKAMAHAARAALDGSVASSATGVVTRRQRRRRLCFNPNFSLRTQLMLTFGTVTVVTVVVVLATCIAVAYISSNRVKKINQQSFETMYRGMEGTTARYLAESLTPRLLPIDVVQILHEAVRDRFAGYPHSVGDESVPFFDTISQSNKYPIVGVPLPLDFEVAQPVTAENAFEHIQDRYPWYSTKLAISTANCAFYMQGMCDPAAPPESHTYWPNCTAANNDISTGGVIAPTRTNQEIHRKASDLAPLIKSIYEYHEDVRGVTVAFANSGAGATVTFPHREQNTESNYTSVGCDWMRAPNPYNASYPIASQEEIDRCRSEGVVVSSRIYNPLERSWCREQALNPEKIQVMVFREAWESGQLMVSRGRAVYDRLTNEFICCILVGSTAKAIEGVLEKAKVTASSIVTVAQWGERGNIVSTTIDKSSYLDASRSVPTVHEVNVGLSSETFLSIISLVNFSSVWDPNGSRRRFEDFTAIIDGRYVSAHPIPPIPAEYDEQYMPEFVVMVTTSVDAEAFTGVVEVEAEVNSNVQNSVVLALIVGCAGLVLATLIILLMADMLTRPLKYMNSTANDIVGNIGSTSAAEDDKEGQIRSGAQTQTARKCAPKTELDDVVKEFNKMIESFSGTSITKPVRNPLIEMPNNFQLQNEFQELYMSRNIAGFAYATSAIESAATNGNDGLLFLHSGENLVEPGAHHETLMRSESEYTTKLKGRCASPLAYWTIIMIVSPLLVTTVAISAVVLYTVAANLESSVRHSEESHIDAKLNALGIFAKLRADLVSVDLARPLRDLHILHRYSSWLLFGGLDLSESFTVMTSGLEECKHYTGNFSECPYVQDNQICGCEWGDAATCPSDPVTVRYQQKMDFISQSQDVWVNGDRNTTSYPDLAFSPETTNWYNDTSKLPGFDTPSDRRYSTAYERHRLAAAIPVAAAVLNHDVQDDYAIGSAFNFEADGLSAGFYRCWTENVFAASWVAGDDNNGHLLRPELCPEGKVGYDPRCREWYHAGRELYLSNNSMLHLGPPILSLEKKYLQTATSPWFQPDSGDHVGQVLINFVSDPTIAALESDTNALAVGGFPILLALQPTRLESTTVIGPNFFRNESGAQISELVLPHDYNCGTSQCSEYRDRFDAIVTDMESGGHASGKSFDRSTTEGNHERLFIAHAPVFAKAYRPLDASDFARGVESSDYLVYSLGLVETRQGILEPFDAIKAELQKEIKIAIAVLSLVILLAVVVVVCISNVITGSIIKTVHFLLELISGINKLDGADPPQVDRSSGCREILNVANAVEALYKLVRCANADYVAGDLESAHAVLREGLRLFKRLGNQKAIAIASNNLGNIMLALYRSLDASKTDTVLGMTRSEITIKGTGYYSDAIRLGEAAYEDFYEKTGWSPDCLDFMQHLSDRYFNRAMFLLTVKKSHEKPDEVQDLGFRDLQIARDMDVEIGDEGEQGGWNRTGRATKLFNVALSRATGHIILQKMGYPDNWDIDEVLENAFALVAAESSRKSSDLFGEVGFAGRLQQIENQLMKYHMLKGDVRTAAQVAIRALVEDEYILCQVQVEAVEVLLAYVEQNPTGFGNSRTRLELEAFRSQLAQDTNEIERRCRESLEDEESEFMTSLKKSAVTASSSSARLSGLFSMQATMRDAVLNDVSMEMF